MSISVPKLVSRFGRYYDQRHGAELLFMCPDCQRQKLYINPQKGEGFCQRCKRSWHFSEDIDIFDTPLSTLAGTKVELRDWLGLPLEARPLWVHPKLVGSSGYSAQEFKAAYDYVVVSRRVPPRDIRRYLLHYCAYGDYGGRIIFSLTYHGDIYSFLGRDYQDRSENRNSFPKVKHAPKSLFAEEAFAHLGVDLCLDSGTKNVVLVEGPFDWLAVGSPPAIALHGSYVDSRFFSFLIRRFDGFVLMLDPDNAGVAAAAKLEHKLVGSGKRVVTISGMLADPSGLGPSKAKSIAAEALAQLGQSHRT